MIEFSLRYNRYGYRKITKLLEREGLKKSFETVRRIRREEGLQVPLAMEDFNESIQINPNNSRFSNVYGYRGVLHQRLGNMEQAIEDLTRFRKLDRTSFNSARIYKNTLKKLQQAKQKMEGKSRIKAFAESCMHQFSI